MDQPLSSDLESDSAKIAHSDAALAPAANLLVHTPARISLQRTGNSIATRNTLAFAFDHAQARDAVHASLSLPTLVSALQARALKPIAVKSAAADRRTYLRRPDLGRRLSAASHAALADHLLNHVQDPRPRLSIILADGLSSLAIDRHAIKVIDELLPLVQMSWNLAPVVIAEQARVALGDEIGVLLKAQLTLMLIGERPGLSSADSLGVYITWNPGPARTNADRNCISNIRDEGLLPADAAQRIAYFLQEARLHQATGTSLKDPSQQKSLSLIDDAISRSDG